MPLTAIFVEKGFVKLSVKKTIDQSRRQFVLSGSVFVATGCSSKRNLVGLEPTRALSKAEIDERGHRIFIATVREPSTVATEFFSGRRANRLNFAAVDVVIPPNHKTGNIERPRGSSPDPDKHFVITNPQIFDNDSKFVGTVENSVLALPKGERSSLLWIHGYNTNLTDAVLRFAQFLEDTGYSGVPILYSWASQARLGAYVYDINSALIARDQLEEVPGLLKDSPVETIDIVAHSMGNLVAMEAARGIANRGLFNVSGKLRSVILASPDIDIDLFIAQLSAIPKDKRRFYVLTSENDQALAVSSLIARNPRVGQLDATLISELGLNVIDLSQVQDTTTVHHSKFADAPEVVRLIGDRILAGDKGAKVSGRAEAVVITASGTIAVVDEAISN